MPRTSSSPALVRAPALAAGLSVLVAACAALAWAAPARAFSSPQAYTEAAATGGGGGRFFTGSPADGFGCGVCHTGLPAQPRYPLYVTGLATTAGFAPAESREIVMSWPEFAARYVQLRGDPMQPLAQGQPLPSSSVVAELIAESGQGSGILEIHTENPSPDELCEQTRANLKPRVAAKLYQVRPGVEARVLEPDENGVVRCEAHQLGQRCVVAVTPCGAKQARFVWTSPPLRGGAIWFSAGFVASEAISGTPEGDSVSEVTFPMQPRGSASAVYEERLQSACAVRPPRERTHAAAPAAWLLLGAALIVHRRGRRARVAGIFGLLVALLLGLPACAADGAREGRPNPIAGLYTPGSALGASDPTDVPRPGMGLGERCVAPVVPGAAPVDAAVVASGELSVSYTTQSMGGRYAPRNCSAVWVETPDGQFVATLEIAAALRRPGLQYMQEHTCIQEPGPDVVTSATMRDHQKPHMATWTGVDFQGTPMPDGPYVLMIEVTESDKEPGELTSFELTKGAPFEIDAPVDIDGPLLSVSLAWTSESGSGG